MTQVFCRFVSIMNGVILLVALFPAISRTLRGFPRSSVAAPIAWVSILLGAAIAVALCRPGWLFPHLRRIYARHSPPRTRILCGLALFLSLPMVLLSGQSSLGQLGAQVLAMMVFVVPGYLFLDLPRPPPPRWMLAPYTRAASEIGHKAPRMRFINDCAFGILGSVIGIALLLDPSPVLEAGWRAPAIWGAVCGGALCAGPMSLVFARGYPRDHGSSALAHTALFAMLAFAIAAAAIWLLVSVIVPRLAISHDGWLQVWIMG